MQDNPDKEKRTDEIQTEYTRIRKKIANLRWA
jgi:hypothetical protein